MSGRDGEVGLHHVLILAGAALFLLGGKAISGGNEGGGLVLAAIGLVLLFVSRKVDPSN